MKSKYRIIAAVLLLLLSVLTSCTPQDSNRDAKTPVTSPALNQTKDLKVHFIDVGQGDSTLIQLPDGTNILIDGGNRGDADVIKKYLQNQNVKMIHYLIATHPHEDHIGSLPAIVRSFEIGSIYMPKITANTKIFEDLLISIKDKGYKIDTAAAGVKIIDTQDTRLTVIAPNASEYDETNNYSAVVKLTYLNTSFLFTGDAEDVSEREILKNNFDIKADVIKVGHHGGRTSSTREFLEKVAPKVAIISLGKDNDYGHPHKETLERLSSLNIEAYRTDEQGTIVLSSDGTTLSINKVPVDLQTNTPNETKIYIGNKNSKIYHLSSCSGLPKFENQVKLSSKSEAVNSGYKPCQICKP
jgi:competence protein ComEC